MKKQDRSPGFGSRKHSKISEIFSAVFAVVMYYSRRRFKTARTKTGCYLYLLIPKDEYFNKYNNLIKLI